MQQAEVSPYWAVAVIQTNRQDFVQELLARDGFETYGPKIRTAPKLTGSLFPGYLMVRVQVRWYPIRWCPGVVKLLMSGDHPARLSDAVVDEIRGREVRGYVKLPKPKTLARGDTVIVSRGMFTGHRAIYDGMSNASRERVLLDLLGQTVTLNMPIGSIEPLQKLR